jgi:hypothetical protein
MSKDDPTVKRFPVRLSADVRKRLAHLAIDRDMSAEELGGQLLEAGLGAAEAETKNKAKPEKAKKSTGV